MIAFRLIALLLTFDLILFILFAFFLSGGASLPTQFDHDGLCGPRCLLRVLHFYGQNQIDLVDLLQDLHEPTGDSGVSVRTMVNYLVENGVHVDVVPASQGTITEFAQPIIVYTPPHVDGRVGHFSVIEHLHWNQCLLWDGYQQKHHPTWANFSRFSRELLLITTPASAFARLSPENSRNREVLNMHQCQY